MTHLLLCSTYELGAQPLGCARPAAYLSLAGHDVRVVDLSLDSLSDEDIFFADAVAFSVPMHTVVRLSFAALSKVRAVKPDIAVAFHGLYAPIALESGQFKANDLIAAGDVESALLDWANDLGEGRQHGGVSVRVEIGKPRLGIDHATVIPNRDGLPTLDRYARLIGFGEERLVGAVETTVGCNHRCRHCPVPVVYDGRSRIVDEESVLCDIDQLVRAGARHIHFGDPDFFNRPAHARRIVDEMHQRHPELSFDATIKVSHILRDHDVWPHYSAAGLLFVVSAFESTSDEVLRHLDKGHTAADLTVAVKLLRDAGIEPRPSLLPFTPWTTPEELIELFDFVAREDLIENVDPVQYGIRLLLPPGSLLLDYPDPTIVASLGDRDPEGIAITWTSIDPLMDEIATAMSSRTEVAAANDEPTMDTYLALRALLYQMINREDHGVPPVTGTPGPEACCRPRLSESWFCCAEPTANQRALLS